jgi:CO/xanthine dehydrogenase Mo-binding subunit
LNVVGNAGIHDQHSDLILTGKMDYACDRLPGRKLYSAFKCSDIAHGTITGIDASAALAAPGVRAVITSKECPVWTPNIFQWGQEVAGVVADDEGSAMRAAQLIKVIYSVSKAVIDPDEAMKDGAHLVGVVGGTNTLVADNLTRGGGGSAGMANADVTLSTTQPWSTTYQHNTLETHSAVAEWVGDAVNVWCSSQSAFNGKWEVATALNLPINKVHFFTHGTGCAHGDKNSANFAVVAAVMSKAVGGAAVQVALSRHDNMLFNTRQFSVKSTITLGAKKDGTFTGIDAKFWGDVGRNPMAPVDGAHFGLRTTYTCPDASFLVTRVTTNTPQRGFWRCVNDPPGAFNYDMAIDKLADRLGMDPYALRMRNLRAADAPDQDPPHRVWGGNGVGMCFLKIYAESGYQEKYHRPGTKALADGRLHGIAITGHLDSHGYIVGASRGALVTVTADGKCLINVGGARGSEGPLTSCCIITAEALGMRAEDVVCGEWGNTDVSLDGGMQAGSTFTASTGGAFYNAALDARSRLFAVALTRSPFASKNLTADQLDARDSSVFLKSDPSQSLTYKQVIAGSPPIAGYGTGWNATLRTRSVGGVPVGSVCNANGSAAACAELAVDTETGEVEILGYWNAVDTGRTIFKQGAIKEMLSGCELQIHQALFAGDVYDLPTGACISSQFTESLVPTAMDMKGERFNVYDLESDDSAGPYGAHGMGEPCVTNYSAIICAIFNATGKWVDPDKGACTPDKVLKALGKA